MRPTLQTIWRNAILYGGGAALVLLWYAEGRGDVTTGKIHEYPFEETSGTTTADIVGGNTLTLASGNISSLTTAGFNGNGFSTGTGGALTFTGTPILAEDQSWTVAFRCRNNQLFAQSGGVALGTSGFGTDITINPYASTSVTLTRLLSITTDVGNFYAAAGDSPTQDNAWNSVVVSYDNARTPKWEVTVNGTQTTTNNTAFTMPASPTTFSVAIHKPCIDNLTIYNRALSLADAAEWHAATDADIESNLVLHAILNETSGTAIADSTGLHSPGTFAGTISTTAAPAQFDGMTAIDFNGSSQDISFADAADLEATANMSVAAWLKTTTTSELYYYTKANSTFNTGFEVGSVGGSVAFVGRPLGPNSQPGSPDYNSGTWRHVGLVSTDVGGGNVVIRGYIDGALIFTSGVISWTPTANSDVVRIGSRRQANWWPGAIFDLRHYARALSAADVIQLTQLTEEDLAGEPPEEPTLAYPQIIISSLDQRLRYQQSHFDTYGVYALAP